MYTKESKMNVTAHVLDRCRQRGIPEHMLEVILTIGSEESRPQGATRYTLNKRDCDRVIHELKELIQHFDRLKKKGVSIVVSGDNTSIITAYRRQ